MVSFWPFHHPKHYSIPLAHNTWYGGHRPQMILVGKAILSIFYRASIYWSSGMIS